MLGAVVIVAHITPWLRWNRQGLWCSTGVEVALVGIIAATLLPARLPSESQHLLFNLLLRNKCLVIWILLSGAVLLGQVCFNLADRFGSFFAILLDLLLLLGEARALCGKLVFGVGIMGIALRTVGYAIGYLTLDRSSFTAHDLLLCAMQNRWTLLDRPHFLLSCNNV
jgi:hypothetical protein